MHAKSVIGYKAVITFVLRAYQKLCSINIIQKIIFSVERLTERSNCMIYHSYENQLRKCWKEILKNWKRHVKEIWAKICFCWYKSCLYWARFLSQTLKIISMWDRKLTFKKLSPNTTQEKYEKRKAVSVWKY